MWDYLHHGRGFEIIERDDGLAAVSSGPPTYMAPFKDWPPYQKKAIRLARGRVLDIGCGAGRVALHLQEKGLDVLGIDNSPLAVKVTKLRGVRKARVMSITQVGRKLGIFDTIVMYGNNFGLMGSFKRAQWLLRRFRAITGPDARIIAESNDPYGSRGRDGKQLRCHLEYHKWNKSRGRMGGQLRLRIRYMKHATPYFDYLLVSKDEMRQMIHGTGWKITRFFDSKGSVYIAVLEKEHSS
jgi:SAM-dependent methyltransferase